MVLIIYLKFSFNQASCVFSGSLKFVGPQKGFKQRVTWLDLYFGKLPGFVGNTLEGDRKGWKIRVPLSRPEKWRSPPENENISACHLPPRPGRQPWINPSVDAVSCR